jgi:hypothetical protein
LFAKCFVLGALYLVLCTWCFVLGALYFDLYRSLRRFPAELGEEAKAQSTEYKVLDTTQPTTDN